MDVGTNKFETEHRIITLLGKCDFWYLKRNFWYLLTKRKVEKQENDIKEESVRTKPKNFTLVDWDQ